MSLRASLGLCGTDSDYVRASFRWPSSPCLRCQEYVTCASCYATLKDDRYEINEGSVIWLGACASQRKKIHWHDRGPRRRFKFQRIAHVDANTEISTVRSIGIFRVRTGERNASQCGGERPPAL